MPTVRISDETANRLKTLARPLDDTWDTFLGRVGCFLTHRQAEFLTFDAEQNGAGHEASASSSHKQVNEARSQTPEERIVARMSPLVGDLYRAVRPLIVELGADVEISAVKTYVRASLKGRRLFVVIPPGIKWLSLFLSSDGLEVEKGASATLHNVLVKRPAKATWPCDALVNVTPETDLEEVAALLRDVYNGATKG